MKTRLLAAVLLTVALGPKAPLRGDEITAGQVRTAIAKGVDYLKHKQHSNGTWNEWATTQGGVTALCTLALLNAGVPVDDPVVDRALMRLREIKSDTTYFRALQTMVFCKADPKGNLMQISENVKKLQDWQITDGPRKGAWAYPSGPGGSGIGGDNSNSQFALLALYEAEQAGVEVKPQTWRLAKAYWERCQNADGSWGYTQGVPGTGSMTAAGITSMIIVEDNMNLSEAQRSGDPSKCCTASPTRDSPVERALSWLGRGDVFSVSENPGTRTQIGTSAWTLYYLYGLERVGRMTAHRLIGRHDWYREGSDVLVRSQDQLSGYWKGIGHAEDAPEIATSLALLFLSKGRRPVVMAKLKHSTVDDWNLHPSDVANLTRYAESRWKRDLTWQVVDLRSASVDDLVQTPVLFFCGSTDPLPSDEGQRAALAAKLRAYVDRGCFLFAEGYCGGEFDRGFRQLMKAAFPEPEYALHLLPPEHPVWFAEEKIDEKYLRALEGIDFGCRTSVVYAPPWPAAGPGPSLSCLWELSRSGRGHKLLDAVQKQVDAGLGIGINVLAYATNREPPPKDEVFAATPAKTISNPAERSKLGIATLRHPGGCDVAPRALKNLLEAAGRQLQLRVNTDSHLIRITDEELFDYPLVFMHGRNTFQLTEGERKRLRAYLDRGGMIMADSVCASRAFTESFRREMTAIFSGKALTAIPGSDPLWTTKYGGFDLADVARRDPELRATGAPLKAAERHGPPVLEGIKQGSRYAVVFSPYDLSCALEKQDSLECQGYVREDAARIALNVVLYALHE